MAKPFDPYHKWLGIPPKDQPPHHYRLLGLELFETDPDAIDAAANQRMAYLQGMGSGEFGEESQKLLNELAAARVCLLDAKRKAEYDRKLKAKLAPPEEKKPEPEKPQDAAPTAKPKPEPSAQSAKPNAVSPQLAKPKPEPVAKPAPTAALPTAEPLPPPLMLGPTVPVVGLPAKPASVEPAADIPRAIPILDDDAPAATATAVAEPMLKLDTRPAPRSSGGSRAKAKPVATVRGLGKSRRRRPPVLALMLVAVAAVALAGLVVKAAIDGKLPFVAKSDPQPEKPTSTNRTPSDDDPTPSPPIAPPVKPKPKLEPIAPPKPIAPPIDNNDFQPAKVEPISRPRLDAAENALKEGRLAEAEQQLQAASTSQDAVEAEIAKSLLRVIEQAKSDKKAIDFLTSLKDDDLKEVAEGRLRVLDAETVPDPVLLDILQATLQWNAQKLIESRKVGVQPAPGGNQVAQPKPVEPTTTNPRPEPAPETTPARNPRDLLMDKGLSLRPKDSINWWVFKDSEEDLVRRIKTLSDQEKECARMEREIQNVLERKQSTEAAAASNSNPLLRLQVDDARRVYGRAYRELADFKSDFRKNCVDALERLNGLDRRYDELRNDGDVQDAVKKLRGRLGPTLAVDKVRLDINTYTKRFSLHSDQVEVRMGGKSYVLPRD